MPFMNSKNLTSEWIGILQFASYFNNFITQSLKYLHVCVKMHYLPHKNVMNLNEKAGPYMTNPSRRKTRTLFLLKKVIPILSLFQ